MADFEEKKEALYEACLDAAEKSKDSKNADIFNQSDLLKFGIAGDVSELMRLCQDLMSKNLFQVLTLEGQVCYRCRTRADAEKMSIMSDKEYMVYTTIEAADKAGIWTKTLAARTNLHQTVLLKALKWLEGKGYVKQIKSVKYPKRKIYMLKELTPAEEVSGGPWFDGGELDTKFIEDIAGLVEARIRKLSWREGPRLVWKTRFDDNNQQEEYMEVDYTKDPRFYHPASGLPDTRRSLVPYPMSYKGFPTASELLNWVDSNGFITGKNVELQDMIALLDVLVYDGRIERVGRRKIDPSLRGGSDLIRPDQDAMDVDDDDDEIGDRRRKKPRPSAVDRDYAHEEDMFRFVLRPEDNEHEDMERGPGNGFSEAPCSRCPVFRLCEEGGPVDARNCEYFGQWLEI